MDKLFITAVFYFFSFVVNANEILLRSDKSAKAYCHKINETVCIVLVKGVSTDVSAIENKNIGKLGVTPKSDYDKVVTFPSKWLRFNKDGNLIQFTTRAWLKGQRYTIKGMVFVDSNGKYVHQ
ncbi:hypothetical protein L1077_08735 [Pseudoalteromonas luteoviolacea]|uniref:hypothetical protein n=1 Tax=Pseudoalteromonas luteoviolacea TaxID=43657 RepID=UPI001F2F64E4|nr:hypothetical protein [Pseudoalteromonas luteoviolacea]MCF6439511.1 hypothetical protein [Pseudoalteromonas luteoviolacea]